MANSIDLMVGRRLAELREPRGLSLKDIADGIDVTPAEIARYETGARIPANRLFQISKTLKVTVGALFIPSEPCAPASWLPSQPSTCEGITLTRLFLNITDARLRSTLLEIADYMAPSSEDGHEDRVFEHKLDPERFSIHATMKTLSVVHPV